MTCAAAKAALVRQPHCFWSYRAQYPQRFFPVPRAQPKPQPLTSMTLQSGSKEDPILTFIHFFPLGCACKQIYFSSAGSTRTCIIPLLCCSEGHPHSLCAQHPTHWHKRSKEKGCSLPECPLQTAADADPKACCQSWLQSCCFTHSHSSHNHFPANTFCWLSIL